MIRLADYIIQKDPVGMNWPTEENQSLDLGTVVHTCNLSTQEAVAGEL
jgi:hypothetical protein